MPELHHNTPEQVAEYLREAAAIVDGLDVPDELRTIAFARACDWLAAKTIVPPAAALGGLGVAPMAMPRDKRRHS